MYACSLQRDFTVALGRLELVCVLIAKGLWLGAAVDEIAAALVSSQVAEHELRHIRVEAQSATGQLARVCHGLEMRSIRELCQHSRVGVLERLEAHLYQKGRHDCVIPACREHGGHLHGGRIQRWTVQSNECIDW